jgi:hypothetical protein
MSCASGEHMTKFKQFIFAPFDIYGLDFHSGFLLTLLGVNSIILGTQKNCELLFNGLAYLSLRFNFKFRQT